MIRNLRKRKNDFEAAPEITLTPLIDTALVLLVIFMVTTPIMQNSIKVDLPKGHMKEAKGISQKTVIDIDRSGNLFLNDDSVSIDSLIKQIEIKVAGNKDAVVYVNGDGATSYKSVAEVVDKIKYAAGVEHVVLGLDQA